MNIENISIETKPPVKNQSTASPRSNHLGEGILVTSYVVLETAAIFLLGLAIAHFYVGQHLNVADYYPFYITPLLAAPILTALKFRSADLYEVAVLQRASTSALSILKCLVFVFIGLVVLGFLAGIASAYSRIWFTSWAFGSAGLVLAMRSLLSLALKQMWANKIPLSRIAILGDPASTAKVKQTLDVNGSGIEIVGVFSDTKNNSTKHPVSGNIEDLIKLGQSISIDRIVIAKEVAARFDLKRIMDELSILPSEVLLYPNFLGETANLSGLVSINQSRLIRIQKKPISEWGLLVKTIEDKLLASLGLVVLSPLMLLVAIGIKLDSPGPVFFRQRRHGYNQAVIDVWKFRTMVCMENGNEFKQVEKNDKRITWFGSLLRRTSIDELPQLFNVLKGEMSIVGPRPHPVAMNSDFASRLMRYDNRHKVKPGITGWAQINGFRGPTLEPSQMRKRIEYDLEYIENWSLWLDVKIILATPYLGLMHKNAF